MTQPSDDCGFDWSTPPLACLRIIGELPAQARAVLEPAGEAARRRPDPTTWSSHEYLWHLVDAFRISAEWIHDVRVLDQSTHYQPDNDKLADGRHYANLSLETGLWSLEQATRLFIQEAAMTDPTRVCHYADWKDVTAGDIMSFLAHEAVHHLWDIRRFAGVAETSHVG
jgi:hypothetical protein